MRTYLILKEKAAQWNADKEIQSIVSEINADDGSLNKYFGKYSAEKASALRAQTFDRKALGARGLKYERLDQLTVELLLGVRFARAPSPPVPRSYQAGMWLYLQAL